MNRAHFGKIKTEDRIEVITGDVLKGCVRDFQVDFTIGVKHYVAFLSNFYVV